MKINVINTGNFKLDGGAMFGVVPKTIWSKTNPADENNMCSWAMRCLLIESEDRKILIDTGIGNKQSKKFFQYFYLHGNKNLIDSLKEHNIHPDDITHVFFTHLHFDHCGGAIKKKESKNNQDDILELVFKNAIHFTNQEHWNLANNPNKRERASFLKENFNLIEVQNKLQFINEGELFPNIQVRFFHGHTTAQMLPFISINNQTLVFMADLLPSIGHIPLPYVMGYDTQPLITLEEKKVFLEEAANKNYILFLEHDYNYECCTVHKTEKGIRVKKYGKLEDFLF
jgi:glyoxylase-like metal-dependent hydrolase (beta-lactamase superfamily II)